jgi:NADH-ubiquinone oxidoreductase chain 5
MILLVTILPTPVSALIHAATLVTAGVYLLLRSSPVIEYGPTTLIVITWVGALTAFFAASTGLLQNDLKRVIAYSTCSQMGYLFMACGLSQYNVALFHLVNHAFFKALLFLAAGAVLHATYDQQDQRRLGGLIGFLPFTYTAILIGSLSLIALPWLTGFYSKDIIIELAYGQYQFSGMVAYWLGTISAGLTAFYSLRLISLTFLTYPNAPKSVYNNVHDAPTIVMIPLAILSILAIFFGYIASDLFVGIGSDFLSQSLFTHPSHITLVEAENIPLLPKLLPIILSIVGAGAALYFYHVLPTVLINLTDTQLGQKLYKYLNGKYYIDLIYNHYIINSALQIGYTISKVLDRGIIELVGPHGLATGLISGSKDIAKLDTGRSPLTSYALYLAIALVTLVMILLSPVLLNAALINGPLILVLLVAMVCLPYINSRTANFYSTAFGVPIKQSVLQLSFILPFLFIYPGEAPRAIFNFEDPAFTCSIIGPVFILSASYKKSFLYFITSVKCKISAIILNLIISPIFRLFIMIIVILLIQWLFILDPVYCADNTMDNIATTSKSIESTTPSVAETFTGNNHATIIDPVNGNNENTTVKLLSKGAGALTETVVENMGRFARGKIIGGYATTKTVVEIFKSTPREAPCSS